MANKYRARKVRVDGMVFDSQKEYDRWYYLRMLEKCGKIEGLERQKKFILIPAQREELPEVYKKGKNKGKHKEGGCIEKECCYYADFVYIEAGKKIVEDVKGVRTAAYKIKKKLMLWVHGIRLREV